MLHYILLLLDLRVLLVFLCAFCVTFAYLKSCRPAGSPPGPATIPFIGNFNILYCQTVILQNVMLMTQKNYQDIIMT